jgi:putative transposase
LKMIRTYKYRLRPSRRFVANAEAWLGFCQTLYNAALEERIGAWKLERKSISVYDQSRQLTEIRAFSEEAKAIHQGVEVDALRRLDKAMKAFFRRVKRGEKPGFPRFRARSRYSSLTFPRMRDGFKIDGDKLKLSKLGSVRMRLHRPLEGTIKTCTVTKQVDGWYAAFSVELPQPEPLPATGASVGVDVGLESFATLSNGERVDNPRFLRTAEQSLKKAQRRVSKLKKRGANRRKAVRLLALRHLHVQRQRLNFAHHAANDLIKRFDKIAVEDLNVKGMVRNHNLAKSISDAGWSMFTNLLTYKAESAGRELVKINPAYTSQVCSGCGLAQKLKLSQRRYTCDCGTDLHRDVNAALNILARAAPVGRVAHAVL